MCENESEKNPRKIFHEKKSYEKIFSTKDIWKNKENLDKIKKYLEFDSELILTKFKMVTLKLKLNLNLDR